MQNTYYNEKTIVYKDGQFLSVEESKTDPYSQSLQYGLGAFEGIKAYRLSDGSVNIFKGLEHYERLQYSCERAGIPYPWSNAEILEATYTLLEKNKLTDAYIRPVVYCPPNMSLSKPAGSSILIMAWHWDAYLGSKLLRTRISSFERPNPKAFLIDTKICGNYVNSILACQEAKSTGYDEAILLDMHGFVAEAPGANVFMEKEGKLYTAPKGNIFPGITRDTIFQICKKLNIPVEERLFRPEELRQADSAFLCGTAAEIVGIESVDGFKLKSSWDRSIGKILQIAYRMKVKELSEKEQNTLVA